MKNLTKEMITLNNINTSARKDIDATIKTLLKIEIEESRNVPSEKMITSTLMPCYYDRAGVPMSKEQIVFLLGKCSRDRVQLIIDVLKEKYSTVSQRKELIKNIEGMRKMSTSTYLKIKMELYPRIHERSCIDEFFQKCTAIYQMQPANSEQVRQIKGIALIPEVYEGLYSRGIKLDAHIDPVNGKILPSFDKEIMDRMNNEDASSFLQFFYTYKQQYQGRMLTPLQRNTLRNLYTQLGETDKASPIHLMYIDLRNYDKVVNELNERIRRNNIAQESAYSNRKMVRLDNGDIIEVKEYKANEFTYENMRESNKDAVETKRLLKFIHTTWSALGERYQDDEDLEALLPYLNITQTSGSHIKEDVDENRDKLVKMIRQKIQQGIRLGALARDYVLQQHEDIIELVYPSL
ncbi:hypothetical protein [Romboutsia sp.]|uniref:hypothetical protein n=1 Tax=Romboutsia sp. TaxID=1965302 RepID=UPI002C2723FF|nr:hypothetical protein [Romboutsia sp.]HSQ90205.1 hypothetical protein [Romboutsia sp.]